MTIIYFASLITSASTIGGRIIRRLDGRANDDGINLSNESKATQALYLFKNGKKPINVCNIDYI